MKTFSSVFVAFIAMAVLAARADAQQTYTWTGAASTAWNTTAANWSGPATVWENDNNAVFGPTGSNRTIVPNADPLVTVRDITVSGTGYVFNTNRINIGADANWQINEDVTINGLGTGAFAITKSGTGTLTFTRNGSATATGFLETPGQTLIVDGGQVSVQGRNIKGNIEIRSGTFSAGDRFSMWQDNATLTISGGALNVLNAQWGIRLTSDNGGSDNADFSGSMSGGSLTVTGSNSQQNFQMGGSTAKVVTFVLSGGTMSVQNVLGEFALTADTAGVGSTTFEMSGGKVVVTGTSNGINGRSASSARQVFDWTGGTIAAARITASNLRPDFNSARGEFVNKGGILAPGDVGVAGQTQVTGAYTMNAGVLAIDIGGTTQAASTSFQDDPGTYDHLRVTTRATLGGRLNVSLIDAYTPPTDTATLFSIVTADTSMTGSSGSFTNLAVATAGNRRIVLADGLSSMLVGVNTGGSATNAGGLTSVPARTVALGGYQATNGYAGASTAWDAADAASWTSFDPGTSSDPATVSSGAIALFADGPTATGAISASLGSTRNVRGLEFASTATGVGARTYTIAQGGSGSILLDNTVAGTAAFITDSSASGNANAVNVPLTLASDLAVSVANAANTLTLDGAISGVGRSLTKTGAGALVLSGENTYSGPTSVAAGALFVNGGLGATAVTVQSGGLLGGSGSIGGSVSVLAGGTFSPGNSPGLLSVGSLSLAGTTLMEIDGLSPRGATGGYDATDVTGLLTYGGSMLIDFGAGITSAFADNTMFNLFDFGSFGGTFASITTADNGSFYGGLTFVNSGDDDRWTAEAVGQTLEFTHSTGNLVLVVVPEPSSLALAGIGVAAVMGSARLLIRRRRS
jgi:fibronectin-binding autotransporter adhesin